EPVVTDVNGDRLLDDLRALSTIGAQPDGGVDRLAWSDADLAGRRWYAERIREAGLEPRVDVALNVFGHLPGSGGPWLLTGSHLDSVPDGGRLDGAYGAVAALEVLRTLAESSDSVAERIEIVGFAEAEGTDLASVSGIVGVHRQRIQVIGTQNHAGTTPFRLRHDAGRAAARAASQLQDLVLAADSEAVANIGMMHFEPGGVNVIPGRAEFTLEIGRASCRERGGGGDGAERYWWKMW